MKKNRTPLIIVAVLVVVAAIIGIVAASSHKSSTNMDMSMSGSAVATNSVTIKNYMFSPMVIKVKVGTKVTWTNQDAVNHTITADTITSVAPSSMDVAQGMSYSFTFSKAGTYTYHCFPHPYMHGTVEVTN